MGPGNVYEYPEGELVLDIADGKTKQMIWRGTAKAALDSSLTSQKAVSTIREAARAMLENFPPPQSD